MNRIGSRLVAIVTTAALVSLLLPALPASAIIAETTGRVAPVQVAYAEAESTHRGIRVSVINLPRDVRAIDIFRSTSFGVEGEKQNDGPVTGGVYEDLNVSAATQYFYTVKVAHRDGMLDPGRFTMLDTLPQVSAVSPAEEPRKMSSSSGVSRAQAPQPARTRAASLAAARNRVSASAGIAALSTEVGSAGQVTTLTVSKTWTAAMSPIFVRGDLVVPAGKTLTILPGTKVYFDTCDSGVEASGTPGNPTGKVDLIVHGKLIAKGSSTSRVLMTSIMSLPASSSAGPGLPQAGDWGSIFTDSRSASEVSYCQIEYGMGCWSLNTARPYYTNNTFQKVGIWTWPASAICFEQPVSDRTTPRIRITGNTISSDCEGIIVFAADGAGLVLGRTGDLTADPYIYGNTIKAYICIDIEAWDANDASGNGNSYVRGTISKNRLSSTGEQVVYLQAETYDGKLAQVSTAFSGNVLTSTQTTAVVAAQAIAHEYGSANVAPKFTSDRMQAHGPAFSGFARSSQDMPTGTGVAYARPKFTSCTLASNAADTVLLAASSASKGTASTDAVFSGGSVENAFDNGLDAYAQSKYGAASASPSFTKVAGTGSGSAEFLNLGAHALGAGTAQVNPRWVGGKLVNLHGAGLYLVAESEESSALAKPYVSGASIISSDCAVYALADASSSGTGNGTANVSGSLVSSTLSVSGDKSGYCAQANADGTGGAAVSSPVFSKVNVNGNADDGVELSAYSNDGPATASPTFKYSSVIEGTDHGVFARAEREPVTSGAIANAVASPVVYASTLRGAGSDALYAEAWNLGKGDAAVMPKLTTARLENKVDDGAMELYAWTAGPGTAKVTPTVSGSFLQSTYGETVSAKAVGPGLMAPGDVSNAVVAGSFKYSTLYSSAGAVSPHGREAYYGYAENFGGTADVTPYFQDCTASALNDYSVFCYANGWGTGAQRSYCAPTLLRVNGLLSGDGLYFEADNYDYEWTGSWTPTPGSSAATSVVTCAPSIKYSRVNAGKGTALTSGVYSAGAVKATNSPYVYSTSLLGHSGGVGNFAYGVGIGDVTNAARVFGRSSKYRASVEAVGDADAVSNDATSNASAAEISQFKYLNVNGGDGGIRSRVRAAEIATSGPVIAANVIGTKWTGSDDGIDLDSVGQETVVTAAVSSNVVEGVSGDGIRVTTGGTSTRFSPVISSNTLGSGTMGVGGDGIHLADDSTFRVTGSRAQVLYNVVNHPFGNGIQLSHVVGALVQGNKVAYPAFDSAADTSADTAGIYWVGAGAETSATVSQVRGNRVTDARYGVAYEDGWATTQYNSFGDTSGRTNRPWNISTGKLGLPTVKLDARNNWWGSASADAASETIQAPSAASAADGVDYSSPLKSCPPKITRIQRKRVGTTYAFTVTFDRPMDTRVKYLRFGKRAPYRTYKTKAGKWSGNTLKVTYRGRLTSGKYYFSGVTDLPGNAVYSKSKYFRP